MTQVLSNADRDAIKAMADILERLSGTELDLKGALTLRHPLTGENYEFYKHEGLYTYAAKVQ